MITLYLHGAVLPGRRDDLERFLAEARPVYEAPGGIRVRLQWDLADPDRFVEIMEYADRDAYDRGQARVEADPAMRRLLERWHALLADGPAVGAYDEATIPPAWAARAGPRPPGRLRPPSARHQPAATGRQISVTHRCGSGSCPGPTT